MSIREPRGRKVFATGTFLLPPLACFQPTVLFAHLVSTFLWLLFTSLFWAYFHLFPPIFLYYFAPISMFFYFSLPGSHAISHFETRRQKSLVIVRIVPSLLKFSASVPYLEFLWYFSGRIFLTLLNICPFRLYNFDWNFQFFWSTLSYFNSHRFSGFYYWIFGNVALWCFEENI